MIYLDEKFYYNPAEYEIRCYAHDSNYYNCKLCGLPDKELIDKVNFLTNNEYGRRDFAKSLGAWIRTAFPTRTAKITGLTSK